MAGLPGVGAKTAQRLAFHIINMPKERAQGLAQAIVDAKNNVHYCKVCQTLTDSDECLSAGIHNGTIKEIMVVENTRTLRHMRKPASIPECIMFWAISPMLGIGPNDIKIKELLIRLQGDVDEVIIATNSSLEGEATAMYLSKLIKPTGIKVTRIASGVPVGGDLEYIDEVTLLRALDGRTEL